MLRTGSLNVWSAVVAALLLMVMVLQPALAGDEPDMKEVEQAYLDQLHEQIKLMRQRLADDPDDTVAQFELARSLYFIGLTGEAKATTQSAKLFDQLLKDDPNNAVYLAYRGSCTMLEAARSWAFWKKQSLADQGLAMIDQAIAKDPDQPEVRFIRACTTYNLPFWFKRGEQSAADFALLNERIEKQPQQDDLLPWMASAALYHHAVIVREDGNKVEAEQALKLAVQIAPDSPAGVQAREDLKELRGKRSNGNR